jgi:hypothetical protein
MMLHDEPGDIKSLGPYTVEFRFNDGHMFTFVLDDSAHARVMDHFFSTLMPGARPPLRAVTVRDAIGHQWWDDGK